MRAPLCRIAIFFAFPTKVIDFLVHLPSISQVDSYKLYQHIDTPVWISKDGYQLELVGHYLECLVIGPIETLDANFRSSDLNSLPSATQLCVDP